MKKAFVIAVSAVLTVGICASVPAVNDMYAREVARELAAVPLPEGTELIEKTSAAGKFFGNGNGMQYFGAVLLKADSLPRSSGSIIQAAFLFAAPRRRTVAR